MPNGTKITARIKKDRVISSVNEVINTTFLRVSKYRTLICTQPVAIFPGEVQRLVFVETLGWILKICLKLLSNTICYHLVKKEGNNEFHK